MSQMMGNSEKISKFYEMLLKHTHKYIYLIHIYIHTHIHMYVYTHTDILYTHTYILYIYTCRYMNTHIYNLYVNKKYKTGGTGTF